MFGIRKREPSNYKCCVQSDAREPALIRTVASAFHLEYMMLVLMVRVFLVVSLKCKEGFVPLLLVVLLLGAQEVIVPLLLVVLLLGVK